MWSMRISILASIVRVSHPEGILRHIALAIGVSFGIMALAMLALRIQLCVVDACDMTTTVLIAQTTTDCVADVLLSALPLWFLRRVKLSRKRRILISSALSASMVINVVTIIEAVALFQSYLTSGSIIFEHVKVACSLIVCNLLVIVTFVYRILHKGDMGIEDSISGTNKIEFTTVDLAVGGFSQETSRGKSSYGLGTMKSSTWSFEGDSGPEASGSVTCRGVSEGE
ncbi:hypothetical protein J3R82DRAFT_6588 [Butyriboletus roseoflavus]|nr:hypothetical protein J3R82DRAFT_6588 [Butyriboletus roseoflavus]